MDPVTRSLTKQQFRLAWLNMFRKEKRFEMEEIQKVSEEIDAEFMDQFQSEIEAMERNNRRLASARAGGCGPESGGPKVGPRSKSVEPEWSLPPMGSSSRTTTHAGVENSRESSHMGKGNARAGLLPPLPTGRTAQGSRLQLTSRAEPPIEVDLPPRSLDFR
eukprot:3851476-Pyramimonas_sp.AAC.3